MQHVKEILPVNEEGDKVGLKFENNQVTVRRSAFTGLTNCSGKVNGSP
ncbi:MAG: hypothetical protein R2861_09705 [Desulfobacterales bacterium]